MHSQKKSGQTLIAGRAQGVRWLAVACMAVAAMACLGGCAANGPAAGVVVQPLSQASYPPTQTVDVLNAVPAARYEALARLVVSDPTGTATSSQLVAQLSDRARTLGANAIVVEKVAQAGGNSVAFNPSGGQIEGSGTGGTLTVTALAIRYSP